MRKIHLHVVYAMITPPRTIPTVEPIPQSTALAPKARPLSLGGKASERIANELAVNRRRADPWRALNAMREVAVGRES